MDRLTEDLFLIITKDGEMYTKLIRYLRGYFPLQTKLIAIGCEKGAHLPLLYRERLWAMLIKHYKDELEYSGHWNIKYQTFIDKHLQEEPTMKPTETITYIYGADVSTMNATQLIDAIKRVKKSIAELEALDITSKYVSKELASLHKALALCIKTLDSL